MYVLKFLRNSISRKIKKFLNLLILLIAGFNTLGGAMPTYDRNTFEYIGEYYFWENPLAFYWYVFWPSLILFFCTFDNNIEFDDGIFENIYDVVLIILLILTTFTITYHYLTYWY